MDKKAKKKIGILQKKIQSMRPRLAGAKQQDDEPGEIAKLEKDIADALAMIEKLKSS